MLFVDFRALLAHKGGQPQPGLQPPAVDILRDGFQTVGEFAPVGAKPVAHIGLPAVVNLKQVAAFQQPGAAFQVGEDAALVNVLVAVIPAGVTGQLFRSPGLYAHGGKPAVKDLILSAFRVKQVKGVKLPAAAQPRAVPADAEQPGPGVILKKGVARPLVQRAEEPVALPGAEIAIALPMGDARLFRVVHKEIIPVAVDAEFLVDEAGQMAAADLVPAAVFRAAGPGLVAVHEDLFVLPQNQGHGGFDRADMPLRKRAHDTVLALPDVLKAPDNAGAVQAFNLNGVFQSHFALLC